MFLNSCYEQASWDHPINSSIVKNWSYEMLLIRIDLLRKSSVGATKLKSPQISENKIKAYTEEKKMLSTDQKQLYSCLQSLVWYGHSSALISLQIFLTSSQVSGQIDRLVVWVLSSCRFLQQKLYSLTKLNNNSMFVVIVMIIDWITYLLSS